MHLTITYGYFEICEIPMLSFKFFKKVLNFFKVFKFFFSLIGIVQRSDADVFRHCGTSGDPPATLTMNYALMLFLYNVF